MKGHSTLDTQDQSASSSAFLKSFLKYLVYDLVPFLKEKSRTDSKEGKGAAAKKNLGKSSGTFSLAILFAFTRKALQAADKMVTDTARISRILTSTVQC